MASNVTHRTTVFDKRGASNNKTAKAVGNQIMLLKSGNEASARYKALKRITSKPITNTSR